MLLLAAPGQDRCARDDIAYLDGERVTEASLTTLRQIEGATGMRLASDTALVTALERRVNPFGFVFRKTLSWIPEGDSQSHQIPDRITILQTV